MIIPTCLISEAVQGVSLSFQSVYDVHGGEGLSLGVLQMSHQALNQWFSIPP